MADAATDLQRQQGRAQRADWADHLIKNDKKAARPILANALTAFRSAPEWQGVLARDEFSLATCAKMPPPWERGRNDWRPRVWTGTDDTLAAEWLQRNKIIVGPEVAGQAVETVAQDNPFHPVRDYLRSLKWDGIERLPTWLTDYLSAGLGDELGNGADEDEKKRREKRRRYLSEVGKRFLISAVARVMKPGCKADTVLVLEGEQGTQKSTALKTLATLGDVAYFTDEIDDLGSKDSALQVQGAWIIEMSELDGMSRGEVNRIKAFLARGTDRFRPPYGKRVVEAPRQCVFAGTVNPEGGYLKDATGNRRFWPVACSHIDIDGLRQVRDQLWAEAVARFDAGEPWWLETRDMELIAQEEQGERYAGDALDALIGKALQAKLRDREAKPDDAPLPEITIEEVLEETLQINDKSRWDQGLQNRIARSLRSQGCTRKQVRRDGRKVWIYQIRPDATGSETGGGTGGG